MPPRIRASPPSIAAVIASSRMTRAVDEREAGHQVGDERQARRAVAARASGRGRAARAPSRASVSASTDAVASQPGTLVGQLEEREREQDQPADEHRAGREHRARRAGDGALAVDAGAGVRRATSATTASAPAIAQPAAARVDAGDDGDADDADPEPGEPRAAQPLVRQEPEHEQGVEDRHRGLDDGGEARSRCAARPTRSARRGAPR